MTKQAEAEMRSWSMGQMKQHKAGHRHPSDPEAAPVLGVGGMWVVAPNEASHNFSCHSCKLCCFLQQSDPKLYSHAVSELTLCTSSQTPGEAGESLQKLLVCSEPSCYPSELQSNFFSPKKYN